VPSGPGAAFSNEWGGGAPSVPPPHFFLIPQLASVQSTRLIQRRSIKVTSHFSSRNSNYLKLKLPLAVKSSQCHRVIRVTDSSALITVTASRSHWQCQPHCQRHCNFFKKLSLREKKVPWLAAREQGSPLRPPTEPAIGGGSLGPGGRLKDLI
jgi:hypothetical protein